MCTYFSKLSLRYEIRLLLHWYGVRATYDLRLAWTLTLTPFTFHHSTTVAPLAAKMKAANTAVCFLSLGSLGKGTAFQPSPVSRHVLHPVNTPTYQQSYLSSSTNEVDVASIQILMSDTGGGHRASANALRDAFNVLHETEPDRFPLKIHCDIVDIYTDYGPFFPYNQYVALYKIMAEYSFLWKWFYEFGATPFGLWLNEFMLELTCFEPFKECLTRNPFDIEKNDKRADMVVSVHPLCQDLPLKILNSLDTNGGSRKEGRVTPFVTVGKSYREMVVSFCKLVAQLTLNIESK